MPRLSSATDSRVFCQFRQTHGIHVSDQTRIARQGIHLDVPLLGEKYIWQCQKKLTYIRYLRIGRKTTSLYIQQTEALVLTRTEDTRPKVNAEA